MSRAILDVQILVPGFIQNVNKFVYICRWPNGLIECFSNICRRINVFLRHWISFLNFYGTTPSKNGNIKKAKYSLAGKIMKMFEYTILTYLNVSLIYIVTFVCCHNYVTLVFSLKMTFEIGIWHFPGIFPHSTKKIISQKVLQDDVYPSFQFTSVGYTVPSGLLSTFSHYISW